jgi:hypothetical protein
MGANQNSSQKLGLYPEIDPTHLSSNSAKTVQLSLLSALRTGLGTTKETRNGASKTTSKINDENQIKK